MRYIHKHNIKRVEIALIIILSTIYFLWFVWPIVWLASENARLVRATMGDEWVHFKLIKDALSHHTFKLDFYNYGHLYFNIALLPLFLTSFFTEVSDQVIIVVLRLVSTVFAILSVIMAFILTRRYYGRLVAWIVFILLSVVSQDFLTMAYTSHPDTVQMFFLISGIYFCCRLTEEVNLKSLILASSSAGLAFATKYFGIFLLPFIWLPVLAYNFKYRHYSPITFNRIKLVRILRFIIPIFGPNIKLGKWLLENVPLSSLILFNVTAYVPPMFVNSKEGISSALVETFKPDIIVVKNIEDMLAECAIIAPYRCKYIRELREERAGYTLMRDFGEIKVYIKE